MNKIEPRVPGGQTEDRLTLASHALCPFVQRAAIALAEKGVAYDRRDVDLANKPDWFRAVSPLGKTPVLIVADGAGDETAIFESAVILEYLEETQPRPLHPAGPLARAEHRAWIEFASAISNDIWGFYAAKDEEMFEAKRQALRSKFERLEQRLNERLKADLAGARSDGPWFGGEEFSLVDAAFGPVFRYFDAFEEIGDFGILDGLENTARWRRALETRPSVRDAVAPDYPEKLMAFLAARGSVLSGRMSAGQ